MHKFLRLLSACIISAVLQHTASSQSLGINTTGAAAANSSILDVSSTDKGLLVPRMNKSQRNAIGSPATGLLVYQNSPDSTGFYYYDGAKWGWMGTLNGNLDTLAWKRKGNAGTNPAVNFIGTTDNQPLNFRQNNKWIGKLNSATSNYFIGAGAGENNTGTDNVIIGDSTGFNSSGTTYSVLIGRNAATNNTGWWSIIIGNSAGRDNQAIGSVFIGSTAGMHNVSGYGNSFIGDNAGRDNISGSENTFLGYMAGNKNLNNHYNSFLGYASGFNNTGGDANTFIGNATGFSNTTGDNNVFLGTSAGYLNTISSNNTMVGYNAAASYNPGSDNTFLGANSDANATGIYNSAGIGSAVLISASNQVRIGNSATTSIGGYANWTNISDGRIKTNIHENVPGLTFINKLRPVTYTLDLKAADGIMHKQAIKDKDGKVVPVSSFEKNALYQKEQIVYTGFIAQEVEEAAKQVNFNFSGVDAAKNDKDLYGLRYAEFVVPLVKAVQEQNKLINDLRTRIELLEEHNKLLKQSIKNN